MLVNVMAIWSISLPFGIFYGHFLYFLVIFGILCQEKSGNPEGDSSKSIRIEKKTFFVLNRFQLFVSDTNAGKKVPVLFIAK
jgi:hypothetical protein